MSHQRRRGETITIHPSMVVTDNRGNQQRTPDLARSFQVRAAQIPQRSARAEVPGQMQINVIRILVAPNTEIDLYSQVEGFGSTWDVVTPPALHVGTKRTRHLSVDLRERPRG